ncbi:MAG TPA: DNA mismatch repair endonuclease MutL [Candidatus Babeliales bacterium]|nr:DNA mismatch repair endonuclease MutL [Candidatus Babeliales bacterium]
MPKIQQLSALEIRKIAAGEVVERPANILKELLENSLDAGATQIEIYLAVGGKQLVRVIDNGCGMSAEDAELCFVQHATSKITGLADLATLQTYGFRGEALASISAVSRVTLSTRTPTCAVGTQLELTAGTVVARQASGGPVGTDLAVHDLFYNVPARQKFLRQTDTEWRQLLTLFQAFVLQHQTVNFKLFHDDKLLYHCPAGDLATRLWQLWDLTLCERTLPLIAHPQLTGRISDYRLERYHRNQLFLFVNGRWVKNLGLNKALLKGYSGLLPAGRYPVAVLFLQVPLAEVDVNVHPRKEEVRFLRERQIETLVTQLVQRTLEQQVNQQLRLTPAVPVSRSNLSNHELLLAEFQRVPAAMSGPVADQATVSSQRLSLGIANPPPALHQPDPTAERSSVVVPAPDLPPVSDQQSSLMTGRRYQLIGQYQATYLLIETARGLMFVDQHAAHERVLYEKLVAQPAAWVSIPLLFPLVLNFTAAEVTLLLAQTALLHRYGIIMEQFGPQQLVIQAVPVWLKNSDLRGLLGELLIALVAATSADDSTVLPELTHRLQAAIACKAAVRAGDSLTETQIYQLLDDLAVTPQRFSCPHGRPTFWLLELKELERQFKRDYQQAAANVDF